MSDSQLPRIERAADVGYRVQGAARSGENRKRKRPAKEDGDVLQFGEGEEECLPEPSEVQGEDDDGLDIRV